MSRPRSTTHLALHASTINDRPDAPVTWLGMTLFDPADPEALHSMGIAIKPDVRAGFVNLGEAEGASDAAASWAVEGDAVTEDFALDLIECFLETAARDWDLPTKELTVWGSMHGAPVMAQLTNMGYRQGRALTFEWEEHNVFTLVNVGMMAQGDVDVHDLPSLEDTACVIATAIKGEA